LLNDDRSIPDAPARYDVTNSNLYHVAATQLAIDREVEERAVTQPLMLI